MVSSIYSLRRSRHALKHALRLYRRKSARLSPTEKSYIEAQMSHLDEAVLAQDKEKASKHAHVVNDFVKEHFKKSAWDHFREIGGALLFALIVAFFIRQFWFELHEVPTGSMRPTIEELDRLLVSKTTFGLHFPYQNGLLFFSEDYIQRGGSIVFSGEGLPISDPKTRYFYFFTGDKRYVKRSIGKPGDILYFYGGRVWGIDKNKKPIVELSDPDILEKNHIASIDHIPYITFEGKVEPFGRFGYGFYTGARFLQMNKEVAHLELNPKGGVEGEFFNGKSWVKDNPRALKKPHTTPLSYSDLWGMGNYAMARLLTEKEVRSFYDLRPSVSAPLYLELRHTPNLTYPLPEVRRGDMGKVYPGMAAFVSIIPLTNKHLTTLREALYTARFYVYHGRAQRYSEGGMRQSFTDFDPAFPGVPDGRYEFYNGIGYEVHAGGFRTQLKENHPLLSTSSENIQRLFNLGTGFNCVYEPVAALQPYYPQRFAYWREGSLFVMGKPLMKKDDSTLQTFIKNELEKQNLSSEEKPYIAFIDHGPPLKENGELDKEFIEAFGLRIPDHHFLALGDNYAMSADSREFGFVPVENLRGAPSFTFWPLSHRVGPLPQPPYPWFTLPNLIVWTIVALIIILIWMTIRKRRKQPLTNFKK